LGKTCIVEEFEFCAFLGTGERFEERAVLLRCDDFVKPMDGRAGNFSFIEGRVFVSC